jgi:lipoate---protein ligase
VKYLDLTFTDPATNLACDEALLDHCESSDAGEVLRLWEPTDYFVVVGYSNKVAAEVNVPGCEAKKIPIYRRFSGGGAVLQGPGCLNYSLVIKNEPMSSSFNIAESFKTILKPHQELFTELLSKPVQIGGISDLIIGDKKFSGNSQHRKSHYTLFHGTFLLNLDLSMIQATLRMPSKEPGYRQHRPHTEFLRNLVIDAQRARLRLKNEWAAVEKFPYLPSEGIQRMVQDRYAQHKWNFKF